jgi:thiol-disulfide isomerase/thioredoxin
MKLLLLLLIPGMLSAQPKPGDFKITIKIDGAKPGDKIYLTYLDTNVPDGEEISDSVVYDGDKAVFTGKINEPVVGQLMRNVYEKVDTAMYTEMMKMMSLPEEQLAEMKEMLLNPIKPDMMEFFLTKGETTIKTSSRFDAGKIEGPEGVEDFKKLRNEDGFYMMQHMMTMDKSLMNLAYMKKDSAALRKVNIIMDSLNKEKLENIYGNFIRNNPSSPILLYAFKKLVPPNADSVGRYLEMYAQLPEDVKQWNSAKRFYARLQGMQKTEIGRSVEDFKQFDSLGKAVSFSSFRGKYVLIELWASWCGPCRMKNPGLVKIYDKYSKKNFTVLGVALEQKDDKKKWLAAISKDKLKWPQLTDFKYWNNAVAMQFGVGSIPFNLLVDPQGKIVGKNLYENELDERLSVLLK